MNVDEQDASCRKRASNVLGRRNFAGRSACSLERGTMQNTSVGSVLGGWCVQQEDDIHVAVGLPLYEAREQVVS